MSSTEMTAASAANESTQKISLSTKDLSPEDRKMLHGIFFHSFNVFAMYAGGARGGASGFMWSILPALKRFYPEHDKLQDALTRHSTWYNITSNVGTFLKCLVAAIDK